MERINLNNYEAFFLDYMEGNLAAQQEFELMDFLNKHPHLKAELDFDLNALTLEKTGVSNFDKSGLRKEGIQADEVDDLMIAAVEGELAASQLGELNAYVQEHNLGKQFNYYKAAVLVPDTAVTFDDKLSLKKKDNVLLPFWLKTTAIGAGLVLLALVVVQSNKTDDAEVDRPLAATTLTDQSDLDPLSYDLSSESIQDAEQNVKADFTIVADEKNAAVNDEDDALLELSVSDEKSDTKLDEQNEVLPTVDELDKELIRTLETTDLDSTITQPVKPSLEDPKEVKEELKSRDEYNKEKSSVVMEEPIKVVTNFAEKLFHKEVTYERGKDSQSGDYVAHHIKLGRFEFERKK